MDPRFPFYNRRVAQGWMAAQVTVWRIGKVDLDFDNPPWDPLNASLFDRGEPTSGQSREAIYTGRGRIEPNKDWRARLQEWDGQVATTHAVRVQVDFVGNTLGDWVEPHVQDEVEVLSIYGDADGTALPGTLFTIRNVIGTSNTWQRTLLCDSLVNSIG